LVQPEGENPESASTESADVAIKLDTNASQNSTDKMWMAAAENDLASLEIAFNQTQENEPDPVEKKRNEISYLYLRFSIGDTTAITELQKRTEDPDIAGSTYFLLGVSYERVNRYLDAATAYEKSVLLRTGSARIASINSAAKSLFKAGRENEAVARIAEELRKNSSEDVGDLYEGLAAIYEGAEKHELRALALEKALEHKPNDANLHFSAAWSYSQGETKPSVLAILHYELVTRFDRHNGSALNNLGVQYQRLDLPIRAVSTYSEAVAQHETLAAANLANLYIRAGFKKEAQEILEEASLQKGVHSNVGKSVAALAEQENNEVQAQNQYMRAANEQQRYMLDYANACFIGESSLPFEGKWRTERGDTLVLSHSGSGIDGTLVRLFESFLVSGERLNQGAKLSLTLKREYLGNELRGSVYLIQLPDKLDCLIVDGKNQFRISFTPVKTVEE
jgi:Flp pilus assembly protein TadD